MTVPSTYATLQTAFTDYIARDDLTGNATTAIAIAEARLNRLIPAVETDVTLTGTEDSRAIDVSANSVTSPLALFLIDPSSSDETELTQKADGTFPYDATSGRPRFWAMDGTNVNFDCPLDAAYTFRFRIRQRYALSDASPTNWLLTNHPDVYLLASLLWGGIYIKDGDQAQAFKSLLDEGIAEVQQIIAEQNRGVLSVDNALQQRARYDWFSDT
jgi:hypothetical protein